MFQPPSGNVEQMDTMSRSSDVVARQNVFGKSAQSAFPFRAQPGVQTSPLAVEMHALASPVKLPPLGPIPTQSEALRHPLVHQRPLHVRPVTHAVAPSPHGSPMPDSLQTGHFSVKHDSISSNMVTLAGYVWLHATRHALAPRQPIAQLSRLLHRDGGSHAAICAQHWASAHRSHCDAEDPELQRGVTPFASSTALSPPPTDPPPVMGTEQPASPVGMQSPFAGGRGSEEHATKTTSAAAARATEVHQTVPTTNHATPTPAKTPGKGAGLPFPTDRVVSTTSRLSARRRSPAKTSSDPSALRQRRHRRILVVEDENTLRPAQRGEAVVLVRVFSDVPRLEPVAHAVVHAEGLPQIAEPCRRRDAAERVADRG